MTKIKLGLVAAILLGVSLIYTPTVSAERYEVSCSNLTISNAGGERKFYVSCDNVWTVTTNADWISVYPSAGKAGSDSIIVLTVKPNTAGGDRNAIVSFTANGKTAEIPLNQVDVSTGEYWLDGDLIPAHLHKKVSEGGTLPNNYKPVCILLFGNGWDLGDNKKGGLYEQFAKGWADLFLQQDIFKDMQDYFDIYAYVSESNQRGNIPFSAYKYTIGGSRDMDKLGSDATFALLKIRHPNAKSAVNVDISNGSVGGWNFYFSNKAGGSGQYAAFGNPQGEQWGQYWWTHEFMGHDFSNMPDYYYHNDGLDWNGEMIPYTEIPFTASGKNWTFKRTGEYPNCYTSGAGTCGSVINAIKTLARDWDNGYWWTTDWESDPEKVIWKTFIGRKGYDNVGVYNGGNLNGIDHYKRPEDHNVMNENWGAHCGANIWHDVGSRLWIWNKVYERAGVTSAHLLADSDPAHPRSLENFIHFDTINGYNANGKRVCNYPTPPVLTAAYWAQNKLFPADQKDYRDWIAECTVANSGGNLILKDGARNLKVGTEYTMEYIGEGNFALFRGLGNYSGTLKYKIGADNELIYVGNGGTVSNLPIDYKLYANGTVVEIPFGTQKPTWEGCTFLGYAKTSTAKTPEFTETGEKTVTINGTTVLYGVWETTVKFDANNTDPIVTLPAIVGTKVAAPADPTKDGYVFLGWYADANFKTVWNFNTKLVTDATTIYAKWVAKSVDSYINLEDPTETVSGTSWSLSKNIYTIEDGANVLITGANNARNIVVTSGATATVTLEDVTIEPSKNIAPIDVTGANVTLLLKGVNTLTTSPSYAHAAIEQSGSGSLTVNNAEAKAGVLYATGGKFSAGIGGKSNSGCGTIVINGGVVFASSDPTENAASHGAAIGGGRYSQGGNITINGGVVSAVSKKPGVAIGNGETGSINTVTINGGTVYASGGSARPIGNGNASGEGVTIGANAIVFMTSNSQPFVGTIEPGATVLEETGEENESFLTVTQNSVDIKIEDPGLTIPSNAILGVPTGSTLYVGIGIALNNHGRVLAGSINNVELADGEPYGNILGWEHGVRGNINTAIRQVEPVPARIYLEGKLIRIEAEDVTGVTVYSISGQIVSSVTGNAITSLPAPVAKGVYIVRVATASGITAKKIVK
ncbi:MAG: InlB B-repeat-containing protein [Dysgonamonadaceae bacterium]|jgi:uncharacterized repeat protein (TIGR02543 family)|nr:InlB B-repeat-containing protein [Dysgonamonadaceae bacterium]